MGLTGPPIAPRMTAFADFAAERASSVRGVPCASMEHCFCEEQIRGDYMLYLSLIEIEK